MGPAEGLAVALGGAPITNLGAAARATALMLVTLIFKARGS